MQAKASKSVQRAVTALPLAFFLTAPISLAAAQDSFVSGLPNAWRSYAADVLSGKPGAFPVTRDNLIRRAVAREVMGWQFGTRESSSNVTGFTLDSVFVASRGLQAQPLIAGSMGTLQDTRLVSAWTQAVGTDSQLTLSGVFAHQSFANPGLLAGVLPAQGQRANWQQALERSSGVGLGLDVVHAMSERLNVRLSAQSRIEMEPFEHFRGVFTDPGKFDIPASLGAGLDVAFSPAQVLGFGVERVSYSRIQPFTSQDLPDRFLSLLGDANSPSFEWRDLTVYTLRWQWQPLEATSLEVRYSTQMQPEPTSELLRRALATEYTNRNFGLTLGQKLTGGAEVSLSANYSPYAYFLGPSLYRGRTMEGNQFELEAVYRLDF